MIGIILYLKYFNGHKFKILIISLLCSTYIGFKFNLILNLTNCPNCYGEELCQHFHTRQIRLTWFGSFLSIFNPKITKSVFFGVYNESEWIVLKRKSRRTTQNYSQEQNFTADYLLEERRGPRNLILCPGFKNFQLLFDFSKEEIKYRQLWLDLNSSIEPLLLMSLGKLPFPRYIGACGDLIVEEYKGIPLTNFLHSDFEKRANLAVKLLKMAHAFTFASSELAFYFTDISQENLVVDSQGNISLVDLDNVILYDKLNSPEKIKNSIHRSEIFHDYEYSFSPSDICSHHLSDHNYYSVCVHLLLQPENGLMREIPQKILNEYSDLPLLLNECKDPKTASNRIHAGEKLRLLIENIMKIYESDSLSY